MPSSISSVRPLPITRYSFLTGGGGTDPNPDMQMVNKIAEKPGRIYLITTDLSDTQLSDSIQNRIWLSEIEKIILRTHPKKEKIVYGARTLDPIRIIAFQ